MKKLLVALGLIPLWVLAETSIQGGYQWTYSITDEGAVIQAGIYPVPTESLTIPESLGGLPVIGIGVDAFKSMTALKSVTFPSKLKFVDDGAFEGCPLTALSLPNTVVRIGKAAFSELLCDDFTIPDSIQKIDAHSFLWTVDDYEAYVGVKNIGRWNLGYCNWYHHRATPMGRSGWYELPHPDPLILDGVAGIADNAYKVDSTYDSDHHFIGVVHIVLPDDFRIFGENAFSGQDSMRDVEIPSSTLEVRTGAFDGVPGPFIFTGAKSDFKFVASSNSFYGAKDTTSKTAYYYEGCPGWKDGEEFHGLIAHPYPGKVAIPVTFVGNGEDEVKYLVEGDAYAKYLPEIKPKTGAVFVHWNSCADDSGITITPESLVADVGIETLYAIWNNVTIGVEPIHPLSEPVEPFVAPTEKTVMSGAILAADGSVTGIAQLNVGKVSRKGESKITLALIGLDGKKKTSKAVTVGTSAGLQRVVFTIKGYAPVTLDIGADGFKSVDGDFTIVMVRNELVLGDALATFVPVADFKMDNLLANYLPTEVKVTRTAKKWTQPKAGKLKYVKANEKKGIVAHLEEKGENIAGLKLSYTAKTGVLKGSFKLWTFDEAKTKLKSVSAKVTGVVINGIGYCEVTYKKQKIGALIVE